MAKQAMVGRSAWILGAALIGFLVTAAPGGATTVGWDGETANGSIDWGDAGPARTGTWPIGPAYTTVSSYGTEFTVHNLGFSATVSGTGTRPFERRDQSYNPLVVSDYSYGWLGAFAPGEELLHTMAGGPLTLIFDSPVWAVGAQIQRSKATKEGGTSRSATLSPYNNTAYIFAYGASGNLLGVQSNSQDRAASPSYDDTAMFIGILSESDEADIWKVVFSFPTNGDTDEKFAVNGPLVQGNPVPIPGAIWLLGAGLTGLAGLRRRRS